MGRAIISEIKKSLHPPLFIMSCLGTAIVCCFSECYTSGSGRTYTIAELLMFLGKEAMFADTALNRYDIWVRGIGVWTQLLLPFLLSAGYIHAISNEKQSGMERLVLVRENNLKYCVSKVLSAILSGGAVMLAGYILFGIIIFLKFPSIYEYPAGMAEGYFQMNPGFAEAGFCLQRCMGAFLYGMCMNSFAYAVSAVFTDRYILICLPLMLKYMWGQALMKIETGALLKGNNAVLNLCSGLHMESVLKINRPGFYWGITLVFALLVYMAGFCLTFFLLREKGEGFGFE